MKLRSLFFLLGLVLVIAGLSGCVSAPVLKDGAALTSNQGLLAFHVTSNADAGLSYAEFASTSTFGSRLNENMGGPKGWFRIKAGEAFHVVPMDAGDYMFSKFSVYPKFTWLQATNRFKVRANMITYIGHIGIKVADNRFGLQAWDRELEMRSYLAEAYPVYFKAMDFDKSFAELNLR